MSQPEIPAARPPALRPSAALAVICMVPIADENAQFVQAGGAGSCPSS